jgi:hypothetical protein
MTRPGGGSELMSERASLAGKLMARPGRQEVEAGVTSSLAFQACQCPCAIWIG